jgi:hypothetical protein
MNMHLSLEDDSALNSLTDCLKIADLIAKLLKTIVMSYSLGSTSGRSLEPSCKIPVKSGEIFPEFLIQSVLLNPSVT